MRVVITAGGTGGHIYPALAILNKIKEREPDSEFLYIGTHNRMEKDIVPEHGIRYEAIKIYGFNKSLNRLKEDLEDIYLIPAAILKCKKLLKEFKPDVVIGVGGYVTFPVITAAHSLGIKTFIHEQNSIPGKSNLALQKKVDLVGVSFDDSKKYFTKTKCVVTGNPCATNALSVPRGRAAAPGEQGRVARVRSVCRKRSVYGVGAVAACGRSAAARRQDGYPYKRSAS